MMKVGGLMKKLALYLINKYQNFSKHKNPTCRYRPTCSQYAKEAFETRNFLYASWLSLWRILRCNPFTKGGYDPVPKKRNVKQSEDLEHLNQ